MDNSDYSSSNNSQEFKSYMSIFFTRSQSLNESIKSNDCFIVASTIYTSCNMRYKPTMIAVHFIRNGRKAFLSCSIQSVFNKNNTNNSLISKYYYAFTENLLLKTLNEVQEQQINMIATASETKKNRLMNLRKASQENTGDFGTTLTLITTLLA